MANEGAPEREALRAALGPGPDCPPLEQLEALVDHPASALQALAAHVQTCAHCQTEVAMLQRFQSGDLDADEMEPVQQITERLRAQPIRVTGAPWWKTIWTAHWLSPAALTVGAALILVAVGLEWRNSQPGLHSPSGPEVFRSNTLSVIAPVGDLQQVPSEIRWQSAPSAVRYEIRLMEVDHTNLWKADTGETRIELPASVRAQIVPRKSLLYQVTGTDASGRPVAESSIVRFRLLQNVYTP